MDTKKRPDHKQVSLRMTVDEYDYLNTTASKIGCTVSALVRHAIKSKLLNTDIKEELQKRANRYKK